MSHGVDEPALALRRVVLLLGVLQITVGCVVGLIPPDAVAWYRGLVMAHIEFTANGILVTVFGFLVPELRLGRALLMAWFATLQIGTWSNGTAGLVAAFLGQSSPFLPSLSEKFPPPGGSASIAVTALLLVCAVTMISALLLTLYGLCRARTSA